MPAEHYDAVVVGAGQGGDPLARAFAQAGHKTALIEREHVGGTCVNTGCTPTKTLAASARVAYLARRAADFGVHAGPVTVNMAQVRARENGIVTSFREGTEKKIASFAHLHLVRGDARFTGPHALTVQFADGSARAITGDKIFLNTGARPAPPPVEGLDSVPFLDYVSIEQLDAVPEHLLVLGGGYVALEFGQMFQRFGSRVTVIEKGPQVLEREDADVADALVSILREDGIEVLVGSAAQRVETTSDGVRVHVETPDGARVLNGSHLLVAAGRTPNTDTLGLDAAGVKTDKHGYISVNERLETDAPGIWALGDVKGGPQFTHISYDDFRILKANLLDGGARTVSDRPVPYTVFTDPQLGRVGLTEREACDKGYSIKVATLPLTEVARAIETGETRGLMKAIVDAKTNQILGCAVLSPEGGEIMAVLQVAMMGRLPYTALRDAVLSHPTYAESLNNLFMTLD